jgi:hypothetical protein
METRKLTEEEVDLLYEYCEEVGIFYFDVQIELVDHLSTSIEAELNKNDNLSFVDAFNIVCENFGGKQGFRLIRDQKKKELTRKYNKQVCKHIRDFFTIPKAFITILISITLFYFLKVPTSSIALPHIGALGVILLLLFSYKINQLKVIDGKNFLLRTYIKQSLWANLAFVYFTPLFFRWILKLENLTWMSNFINGQLLSAFFITLYSIIMYENFFYLPQRIKADFIREYPQFVKA